MSDTQARGASGPRSVPVTLQLEELNWLQDFCRRTEQEVGDLLTRIVSRELAIMSQIAHPLPDSQANRDCHACKGTGRLSLLPPG